MNAIAMPLRRPFFFSPLLPVFLLLYIRPASTSTSTSSSLPPPSPPPCHRCRSSSPDKSAFFAGVRPSPPPRPSSTQRSRALCPRFAPKARFAGGGRRSDDTDVRLRSEREVDDWDASGLVVVIDDDDDDASDEASPPPAAVGLYVRFSPLIGGPSFLPLHAEVILLPEQQKDSSSSAAVRYCHRFDFLPSNPTDPQTLLRLVTLRDVPGRVRMRRASMAAAAALVDPDADGKDDDHEAIATKMIDDDDETTAEKTAAGVRGIVFRLGSVPVVSPPRQSATAYYNDDESIVASSSSVSLIVSRATDFAQSYRNGRGKTLSLIGNNCLTYAYELIRHLDDAPPDASLLYGGDGNNEGQMMRNYEGSRGGVSWWFEEEG